MTLHHWTSRFKFEIISDYGLAINQNLKFYLSGFDSNFVIAKTESWMARTGWLRFGPRHRWWLVVYVWRGCVNPCGIVVWHRCLCPAGLRYLLFRDFRLLRAVRLRTSPMGKLAPPANAFANSIQHAAKRWLVVYPSQTAGARTVSGSYHPTPQNTGGPLPCYVFADSHGRCPVSALGSSSSQLKAYPHNFFWCILLVIYA